MLLTRSKKTSTKTIAQEEGKKVRNKPLSILIIVTMLAVLLAACGPTPEPQTIVQTVEVEKTVVETVEVEK
jgi:ABC-type uncharacterized transport system auxiliary subunit